MNFSQALEMIKSGNRMTREGWHGAGQYLTLQSPDENSKISLPYIYITTAEGLVPWVASQSDLLAEDWAEAAQESDQ